MLNEQADAADAYAEQREKVASKPFFSADAVRMRQEAFAHRKFAEYTRKIKPEQLTAYLVKVRVPLQGTGAFDLQLSGDKLELDYGALGSHKVRESDVFLVVFVERPISAVEVRSTLAE
jgi:hypothetical protein